MCVYQEFTRPGGGSTKNQELVFAYLDIPFIHDSMLFSNSSMVGNEDLKSVGIRMEMI